MKEIIKYAAANRIANNRNMLIKKSLENKLKEDKVIRVVTKEFASFIVKLFRNSNQKV